MKKLSKRQIFFIIYAIIILIILIYILFIADDSFFLKNNLNLSKNNETEEKETYRDYEEQKATLQNKVFSYKYEINYNGIQYICNGTKNKNVESGVCTEPQNFSYTEENYNKVFKDINTKNLDVDYIFELIADIEPEQTTFNNQRTYDYELTLDKLKTDITIITNYDNITKICIANGFETYILTYSNISD